MSRRRPLSETQLVDAENLERLLDLVDRRDPACVVCGCTEDRPCPDGCGWVMPGWCSSCADRLPLLFALAGRPL